MVIFEITSINDCKSFHYNFLFSLNFRGHSCIFVREMNEPWTEFLESNKCGDLFLILSLHLLHSFLLIHLLKEAGKIICLKNGLCHRLLPIETASRRPEVAKVDPKWHRAKRVQRYVLLHKLIIGCSTLNLVHAAALIM